ARARGAGAGPAGRRPTPAARGRSPELSRAPGAAPWGWPPQPPPGAAPASARRSAVAAPIPREPPVTRATRPLRSEFSTRPRYPRASRLVGEGTDLLDEADHGLVGGRERGDVEGRHAGLAIGGQALPDVRFRADERGQLGQLGGH